MVDMTTWTGCEEAAPAGEPDGELPVTGPVQRERRNLRARPMRDTVAAHFGIHPVYVSYLPQSIVGVMAARITRAHHLHAD
jgi:hypothetical protein